MNEKPFPALSVIRGGADDSPLRALIGGAAAAIVAAPAAERARRRALACRPTDALEPWRVEAVPGVQRLADAAAKRGVAFDTAAAVVVERSLVVRELGLEPIVTDLDRRAAAARPRRSLCAASAAYLRELGNAAAPQVQHGGAIVVLSLPARLNDRIATPSALSGLLDPGGLGSALSWERAAVTAGSTLTEWVLLELLSLRAQPA